MLKKYGEKTVNLSLRVYLNKIENRITFEINTGYYLEILTSETVKFLQAVKIQQLIENENDENVPHLGSTEVVFNARKVSKYGIFSGPYFPVFGT